LKPLLTISFIFLIGFTAIAQSSSTEPIEVSLEDVQKANERDWVSYQLSGNQLIGSCSLCTDVTACCPLLEGVPLGGGGNNPFNKHN
jgi:hypothetical protein